LAAGAGPHPKAAAIETIKEFGWTEKADLVFI
jgi:hypothetical protein